jgi:16S rRNA (guanine527-N7)-methyltransferase
LPDQGEGFSPEQSFDQLQKGLHKLGQSCSEKQTIQLSDYLGLLCRWNSTYNLTAINTPEDMLVRHLLDSLAVAPYLRGKNFLDVGTGAGLPGIPLAIVNQQRKFVLLDSNGKKTRFLFHVRTQLGLDNVEEVQCRAEKHEVDNGYSGILSRGLSSLREMVQNTKHLLAPGGRFYAMKGKFPDAEVAQLSETYKVEEFIRLLVPELDEDRHLIIIKKK